MEFDSQSGRWTKKYAPHLHLAIDFDYKQLEGAGKPHLQEFRAADGKAKVLRILDGHVANLEEVEREIEIFSNYLELLRASGIAVLTPEYKIADGIHDKSNLYVVVDKIENATQFDDALESGDVDKVQAYDKLAKKLVGLVVAACESGGWICPESCRLDQYLIDNSQPAHSSPVFVDVDPERVAYIDPNSGRQLSYHGRSSLDSAIKNIAEDIIRVSQVAEGAVSMGLLQSAVANEKVIALVPYETIASIKEAIRTGDASFITIFDDEDW